MKEKRQQEVYLLRSVFIKIHMH